MINSIFLASIQERLEWLAHRPALTDADKSLELMEIVGIIAHYRRDHLDLGDVAARLARIHGKQGKEES